MALWHSFPQYGQQKPKGEQPFIYGTESSAAAVEKPSLLQRAGGCVMSMVRTQILADPLLVGQVESIQCKRIDNFQSKSGFYVLQVKIIAANSWV